MLTSADTGKTLLESRAVTRVSKECILQHLNIECIPIGASLAASEWASPSCDPSLLILSLRANPQEGVPLSEVKDCKVQRMQSELRSISVNDDPGSSYRN